MKLTEARVKSLRAKRKRFAISDGGGLQLVVLPSGRKSWVFRYRLAGQGRAMKLGTWPELSLVKARVLAKSAVVDLGFGKDPRERSGARHQLTVRAFAERWLKDVVHKVRKNPRPVERQLERCVYPAIGRWPIRRVGVQHVRDLVFTLRDRGKPEAAASLRHTLKRLFDYAVACEASEGNPVRALPLKFITMHKARNRALSERELKQFLHRLQDPRLRHFGWALELMLLTLCRKSELRLARWEHIDFEKHIWEIPMENSKTGVPHIVYLSLQAEVLLRCLKGAAGRAECVLPKRDSIREPIDAATLNKAMARVRWGIHSFVPHDLRRTASTLLNEQGFNRDVIEKALNHGVAGVRGTYNRAEYREERRRMLQAWGDYLEELKA